MLSYEGKVVLAPMVRIGTLPMRLLALEYGADLVWTPETVDKKLIGSIRTYNVRLGTYDYIKGNSLVLRTHPSERDRLVLQLGSADAELALQAARLVENDVSGVDLNCGCPKHFSVHAGMGAALLGEPDRLCGILKKLVSGLRVPVSAKIRLLPDREGTLDLVRRIGETGVKALTVHFRTAIERPRDPAHYELLSDIVKASTIPVIANGDIYTRVDVERVLRLGLSVMLARAAQWNPSIFRQDGELPILEVTKAYLHQAMRMDNPFANTKYTVLQMWLDRPHSDRVFSTKLQQVKNVSELCRLFKMDIIEKVDEDEILYNCEDE